LSGEFSAEQGGKVVQDENRIVDVNYRSIGRSHSPCGLFDKMVQEQFGKLFSVRFNALQEGGK